MKKVWKKVCPMLLSATLVLGVPAVNPVWASEAFPNAIQSMSEYSLQGISLVKLQFTKNEADWLKAITSITVDGEEYSKSGYINMMPDNYTWNVEEGFDYTAYQPTYKLYLTNDNEDSTDYIVSAEGYEDCMIRVEKQEDGSYMASIMEVSNEPQLKTMTLDQTAINTVDFGNKWAFTFADAEDYVSTITNITVNGEDWEAIDYSPSTGGKYYKDTENNQVVFCKTDFLADGSGVLKSGDVITIQSSEYEDFTIKMNIKNDSGDVSEDDGKGDIYQLHVKLEGSFEAALAKQQNYDGVSSATGSATSNKNSKVKVYTALTEGEPTDEDWTELNLQSDLQVDSNQTKVTIVPDVENGTPADSDSGMEGVYLRMSSDLTLNGTPKDPGTYLISVTLVDAQGRTATSNALPFKIYSGDENLSDMLSLDNLTQTADGKYMWKDMEPWNIRNFGSNVEGEENAVRVPEGLKAWYGSSESGLYGELGYAIDWADVEAGNIPQTLYVPAGCNLTLVNMELQSSVRVVVENGGKLTLRDSVVQGVIDVLDGGTFSMNYNDFGGGQFLTGASVDGQIILHDGAALENAAIYSHMNYIANGDKTDRTGSTPVVVTQGDVTLRGQVFISGDEAGSSIGQTGLMVQNGTLTLEDDAVLAVYGGTGKVVLNADGGTAIVLDNGEITGNGKVIALGGAVLWGNGGHAVTGHGTISAKEAFLQGATAFDSFKAVPGSAVSDDVKVTSAYRSVKDGSQVGTTDNDPIEALYWKTGIDVTPELTQYAVEEYTEAETETTAEEESETTVETETETTVETESETTVETESETETETTAEEQKETEASKKSGTSILQSIHKFTCSVAKTLNRGFQRIVKSLFGYFK